MKNKYLFTLLLLAVFKITSAQKFNIQGFVLDKADKSPLIGANVVATSLNDSTQSGAVTGLDGDFQIPVSTKGRYLVQWSYLGYQSLDTIVIVKNSDVNLGNLLLSEAITELGTTTIQGKIPPVVQKGDTTQYDAAAYKTNPDATSEDLVAKLPGVEVSNGQVKAQGENVARVQVDGKMYFGDDATAVLKNLPAEVIDKVQLFDQRSDQAQFTGFDDGNTSKTMNIITKPSYRNGVFGRVYGAYGWENSKYKSGLTLNKFKDKQKITLLYQSNNVNEQNFSSEDLSGVGASTAGGNRSGGGGSRGGGGMPQTESFQIAPRNGIATTHAVGLNFADNWGNKVDVSGSYFINWSNTNAISTIYREFILPSDSGLVYRENNTQQSKNTNHRVQFRFLYNIDSSNSFIFEPRLSFQKSNGNSEVAGFNTENLLPINSTFNTYKTNFSAANISLPLLYRRKLNKIGRTFSIGFTPGYNFNNGDNNLISANTYEEQQDSINQNAYLDKVGYSIKSMLAYTEPLGKKGLFQFNYLTDYRWDDAQKSTFLLQDNTYSAIDSSLSNTLESNYLSQQVSTAYMHRFTKVQLGAGLAYQWAQLTNQQYFPDSNFILRTFHSILPNARLQINFNPKKSLRFFYRSSNNAPSISQLQNVVDNSNPLQLRTGNENLQQDFRHDIRIHYATSNTTQGTSFFVYINTTFTQNYIGNSTFIAENDTVIRDNIVLNRGTQLTVPQNLNGSMAVRLFSNYSKAIKKLKSNFNINAGINFARTPSIINNTLNYLHSPSSSLGLVLVSNISEKLDFTISTVSNVSFGRNSVRKQLNNTFYSQNNRAKLNWMFWKGFVFQSDVLYQLNTGLSAGFSQNFVQWNAALGYKFGKKKEADLRFSVYDILNQNRSIQRNITDTYIEDNQSNILQRYYMLTFTYQLKFFKSNP